MTARHARLAGVPVLSFAAGLLAVALTGCTNSNTTGGFVATSTSSSALVVAGGNNQTGVTGTSLPTPLTVTLVNAQGQALSNEAVTFAATTGGGSVTTTSVQTNALGQASTSLTLGARPGLNQVVAAASVAGVTSGSLSVTFTETATAGPPSAIFISAGGSQSVTVGTASSQLLVTVSDVSGNAVGGAIVLYNVTSGSGTFSASTAVTNALGQAETTFTPSSTGTVTITATVANVAGSTVTFTITSTPVPPPAASPAVSFSVPGTTQIAGTVGVSNSTNPNIVVGGSTGTSTTAFTKSLVVGSQIFFSSQPGTNYTVAAVTDDQHITLVNAYTGPTVTGGISITILGFTEPRGIAVSQSTSSLWLTAVYNGTIAGVDSPSVVLKTTKTGGLTANTVPIAMPSIPGNVANLAEPIALALSKDETTLYILDIAATPQLSVGTPTNPQDSTTGAIYQIGANGGPITAQASSGAGIGVFDAPTSMIMSTDGQRLYLTAHDPVTHIPEVLSIDVSGGIAVLGIQVLASGGSLVQPTGLGTSLDGKTLYVADSSAGPNGSAQLFGFSASGGVTTLTPLASGGVSETTRVGGGVVAGFDGGINLTAYAGAVGKLSSIPVGGGAETVRTSSTGSGPMVSPFQATRDGNNIYTVDSEATGNGCVVVSQ